LRGTIGGEKVAVECTGGSNEVAGKKTGLIVQKGPLAEDYAIKQVQLEFTSCKLTVGPTKKCEVD
jgi:hypothetical protein